MKVGIYTIHACNNFGALLQAYATARFLNSHNIDAEIVNVESKAEEDAMCYRFPWTGLKNVLFNLFSFTPAVLEKKRNFVAFRKLLPLSARFLSQQEYVDNPIKYDVHLVGSDQVWNVENGLGNAFFFLPFLGKADRCVSYASSFGNLDAVKKHKSDVVRLLEKFERRSVRESDAADYLSKECGLPTDNVLDPTFLLDASEWTKIAGDEALVKGKYILYYGFDTGAFCAEAIRQLRKKLQMPVVGVSVSLHSPYRFDRFYQKAGPIEFLNLIKNASLVLTSSFHGMALSVNFRKDFVVLKHGTRMSRMESLLSNIGLSDRIVSCIDELHELLSGNLEIDYSGHEQKILQDVDYSRRWLVDNLN